VQTQNSLPAGRGPGQPVPLHALAPHNWWTCAIDEAGSEFDPGRFEQTNPDYRGRVVALLVPEGVTLPELRRHAIDVKDAPTRTAALVRQLAGYGVCVLGLQADAAAAVRKDAFSSLAIQLFKWIARAVPHDDITSIFARVEERAEHKPGEDWVALGPSLEDTAAAGSMA
jgi:hypothetical protein